MYPSSRRYYGNRLSGVALLLVFPIGAVASDFEKTAGMVYIPAGKTLMGTTELQRSKLVGDYDINPQLLALQTSRAVNVPGFLIDRYEVTNKQYREFIRATGHRQPIHWVAHGYPHGRGQHPVTGVDYEDAVTYAKWIGKRLPREAEWERAARGPSGRLWPWGDRWDRKACCWGNSKQNPLIQNASPVGTHPRDRSLFGVMDMAGNLTEWVEAPLPKSLQYTAIVKGGSFVNSAPWQLLCATRNAHPKGHGGVGYIGFRCALDAPDRKDVSPADKLRAQDSRPATARSPRPDLLGKHPIQLFPIYNYDPERRDYQNTMASTFLTISDRRPSTLKETTPWRIEIRVPYLPDDRFTLFFENHWFRPMQAIRFNDDFTQVVLKSRFENHLDVDISVKTGRDFVDIRYELENLKSSPLDSGVEMCFQPMGAPNFRDHDGTRTFIQTATGFHSTAKLNRRVIERLWCQDYTIDPATGTSTIAPEKQGSLIAIVSRDGQWLIAPTAMSGPAARLFNNWEYSCLHCTPPSRLAPREQRVFKQRVYFLHGSLKDLARRFQVDYEAEQRATTG